MALTPQQAGEGRRFLFLQGPHGPFFGQLAARLAETGATTLRVGFNQGDAAFWPDRATYFPFTDDADAWPEWLATMVAARKITDIVLYGDARPVHRAAIEAARARGLRLHFFEEGYLRPFWITYERAGVNGQSRLADIPIDTMRACLDRSQPLPREVPATWGELREHVFYGAVYHFHVMARNRRYPGFRPHRNISVADEFRHYLRRLLALPVHAAQRFVSTRRIRRGGYAYHLLLLQLDHDASIQAHSSFRSMQELCEVTLAAFAKGAPGHHHLVIKAHPLDDGRVRLRRFLDRRAADLALTGRVHFVRGGKLAPLLDPARSVVTVNSTAAHQALWRGIPVRALGRAVYVKPELVSDQPLDRFFADPRPPDPQAYRIYRRFLLATSQVPGGFYSASGRRRLLDRITDRMLAERDAYDQVLGTTVPSMLRLVSG